MRMPRLGWTMLATVLAAHSPGAVQDPTAVYEAVLVDLNQSGRPLVLNTKALSAQCSPHCTGPNLLESHPRPWLERLLAKGVIAETCTPPDDRAIGCIPGEGATGVSLGPVVFEDGRAETDVILFGPSAGRMIDAEGVHFVLERHPDGRWVVVARRRTWVS